MTDHAAANPAFDAFITDARRWMFEDALPFWGEQGVDRRVGGYVESLDFDLNPTATFRRTRVVCRQIYVFAHAHKLGWTQGAALSDHGFAFLRDKAWLGDDRGWTRTMDAEGRPLDTTPDLYDHAFALFALGWRHLALGCKESLALAHRTMDFIDKRLRPSSGEGFLHELPPTGWRLQNPHMHLLEAALVLCESSDEPRWRSLADELASLFARRFFDGRTLAEYFTDDWSRAPGEEGRLVEPGHQFEWSWILANHHRLNGADVVDQACRLFDFAERHGVDPQTRAVYDVVRDDGTPLKRSSRTWPNTERIKGAVAMHALRGDDPRAVIADSGRVLLDRYLAQKPPGVWIDVFDEALTPTAKNIPTSTLYHVFLAFAEAVRIAEVITTA
jgi:N-acylglucosamine 2-epimerase/mannose-6-phosphate isomerase